MARSKSINNNQDNNQASSSSLRLVHTKTGSTITRLRNFRETMSAAATTSCFDLEGGDEELLEVRGLLAYIDTQEQMLKLQASELSDLRAQIQNRDLEAIEEDAWKEAAVMTNEVGVQTDAPVDDPVEDDSNEELIFSPPEQDQEAMQRAAHLAVELARTQERAELLQEDLVTTKQQLQACQEKLREMILGHSNNHAASSRSVLPGFRTRRGSADNSNNHTSALKSFFMRSSSSVTAGSSDSLPDRSVQTMPMLPPRVERKSSITMKRIQSPTAPFVVHDDSAADEIEVSTVHSASSNVDATESNSDVGSFKFVAKQREAVASISFYEDEVEEPQENGSIDKSERDSNSFIDDHDRISQSGEEEEKDLETFQSDDEDNISYTSVSSNNKPIIIHKLDAAIEDPRPWKHALQQRNQTNKARIIQKAFRMYFIRKDHAAIKLQSWWRMTMIQLEYQHCLNTIRRRRAAIVLQCAWRMNSAVKRYRILHAAVTIQAQWRLFVARQDYNDMTWATVTVQKYFRRHDAVMNLHDIRDKYYAAIVVQKHARGFLLRRDWARTKALAVKLVTDMTISLSKSVSKKKVDRLELVPAASVKTHHQTVLQATKQLITLTSGCPFLFGYSAAPSMKTNCLLHPLWKMVERHVSVVVIQATWRRYLRQKQWEACRKDAVVIQAAYRRHQKQQAYVNLCQKIILIQTSVRCFHARKLLAELQEEKVAATRNNAAVKIQAHVRKLPPQRQYACFLLATLRIQTSLRKFAARQEVQNLRQKHLAATIIQLWYQLVLRRNHARASFLALASRSDKHDLNYGATVRALGAGAISEETTRLDDSIASKDAINNPLNKPTRPVEELVALSYNYTTVRDNDSSIWDESFDRWDDAAIYVHTFFIGLERQTKTHAANVIAQSWRHHVAIRAKRSKAAHWIQCYWRERLAVKNRAAMVIQNGGRKRAAKKRNAAKVIQGLWREYYVTRSNSATLVQMMWRGFHAWLVYERYLESESKLQLFIMGNTSAAEQSKNIIDQKIRHQVTIFQAALTIQRWWWQVYGFMMPYSVENETFMVIEFDPNCSVHVQDLAVDKSMSFDQSFVHSECAHRRQWKVKKPKVWASIRERASVPLKPNRPKSRPRGYISVDDQNHERYAAPTVETDRYTPASCVVVSDDEKEDAKSTRRPVAANANGKAPRQVHDRKPVLANFPTLKLSLETKKKLKKLKSSLLNKKRVNLMDPKVQRKLDTIDNLPWADFDFRDADEANDIPVTYSVSPRTRSKEGKSKSNEKTASRNQAGSTPAANGAAKEQQRATKNGKLTPLVELPADISHCCESENSFILAEEIVVPSPRSILRDDVDNHKENVHAFKSTFTEWSVKADGYEESGLADLLGTMNAFRVNERTE
ncbi:hypothetical protein MPSEU_000023100 [Mayamaea pseudoterrestris]|nr:hypothetical protein MPSEU_000023100 [Mayamaea pseudoterrestris]